MDDQRAVESFLRKMVFPILALVFIAQALACRALFADGSDALFAILKAGGFEFSDPQRIVNHLIMQAPIAALIYCGVHNLVLLRYVYSTWFLLCPLLVWVLTLWKLRDDRIFWPFFLIFAFTYFNTDYFIIGEFSLCFALAAYCCVSLLLPLPARALPRAGLMLAATAMSFNYPSTLFHAPMLLLLLYIKPEEEWNGAPKTYRYALASFFVLSIASALWNVLLPRDGANFAQARDTYQVLHSLQFWSLLVYAGIGSALCLIEKLWVRVALTVLSLVLLVAVYINPMRVHPFPHYALRMYVALALVVCGIGLWWWRRLLQRRELDQGHKAFLLPAVLSFAMLLNVAMNDILTSADYANYIKIVRDTLNNRTGILPYEDSGLDTTYYVHLFHWIWTYPSLSVVLRDSSQGAVLLNPENYDGYQPFNPRQGVPDLDRYYH